MGASKICLSSIVNRSVKLNGNGRSHRYRSSRRLVRNRQQAAVIRAVTGAKIYLDGTLPTLAAAATACGSNVHYVARRSPCSRARTAPCWIVLSAERCRSWRPPAKLSA